MQQEVKSLELKSGLVRIEYEDGVIATINGHDDRLIVSIEYIGRKLVDARNCAANIAEIHYVEQRR